MVSIKKKVLKGHTYYYLEHSIRDGQKVQKKEIYLGREIPSNIEEIKKNLLDDIYREKWYADADEIKKNYSKNQNEMPKSIQENELESFAISFTYDTRRIEGSTLTRRQTVDLLERGIAPKNKSIRDALEAEAHRDLFFDILKSEKDLSLHEIEKWYWKLFDKTKPDITDKLRTHKAGIVDSKFMQPTPVEIYPMLTEFFQWYNNQKNKLHPIELAALAHLKFVTVHPFKDGNGIISRLIMNLILDRKKYPMFNISYDGRDGYYKSLEHSQMKKENRIFLQWFAKRYIKEHKRYLRHRIESDSIPKGKMRTGYTTGTSATAGAKAGILAILNQEKIGLIDVTLPKKSKIQIKIGECEFNKQSAHCYVIKDGGDDPDVTHGAEIHTNISITNNTGKIEIDGGEGVGRVTKPGLGLEVGSAAINPTPKRMITENIIEVAQDLLKKNGVKVIVSVPKGKEIAPKTDNPRLGIMGGISILGTSGIVVPYSTASFAASIRQSIDVTIAMGNDTVVLTTGGRSEDYAKSIITLPDHCFVQMGDFSGYTVQQCAKKGIRKAYVAGFIGKLTKIGMGVKQTHVKGSKVDMEFLAELAQRCNASSDTVQEIKKANTARHVFEIVSAKNLNGYFDLVCSEVYNQLRKHSEEKFEIDVIMFDFDGNTIGKYPR